ncbi:hypothetical protein BHM03_00010598 [Ensete ventricosum]|nr:hypothetical protein BHM03_00010598 [Ensete ventricosum]
MFVVEQVLPLSATSLSARYFYLDMDEYVGKRAAGEHNFPRRPSIASRNQNNQGRSVQYPDRLGYSARQNTTRGALIGSQEKYKFTRAPFSSMNHEAMDASSSRSSPISSGCGRSFRELKNKGLLRESTIAESSTKQDESEDLINIDKQVYVEILNSESQRRLEDSKGISVTTENFDPSVLQNISTNITESSITASVPKPHRQINRQFGTGKQDPSSSSYLHHSSVSHRNSSHAVKPISQRLSSGPETCSLKNLSCTSVSDILPSGCSSSDFTHHRRADAVRKRPSGGDSSAARSKGASASSGGGYVVHMHTGAGSSSSSRDQSMHQLMSRTRNQPTIRDGSVSVRTHRGSTEENQMRLSVQGDDSTLLLHEPIMTPEYQWAQFSSPDTPPENASRSSPALYNLYGRPGSGNRASQKAAPPSNTMALASSQLSFLTGSPLPAVPKHNKKPHLIPLKPCRSSMDKGSSSERSGMKLAQLAMVAVAAGVLTLGSVEPAVAAKSGGRIGGQAFRSAAPRSSGPRINNSR